MSNASKTKSALVRARLHHPVLDSDAHMIEFLPLVLEFMREVSDAKFVEKFVASFPAGFGSIYDGGPERVGGPRGWYGLSRQERHDLRVTRPGFWGRPTANALDYATVMMPNLFRERLDDLGIDFAVVYTTAGLSMMCMPDEEMRRVGCRALNTMYAELFDPHADRMTVPAVIPMFTPQEALDELEHAVNKLGMKAIVLGAPVRRPIAEIARRAPEVASYATWIDVIAHASDYDYDPVWKRCVELKVVPASHNVGRGWGTRTSPDNFVYNNIGHFAASGEAFCKALVLGGVVQRFPHLKFAFLEGGVGSACNLYNDLIEHWEHRNLKSMREHLDPAKVDRTALAVLIEKYGGERLGAWFRQNGRNADFLPDWPNAEIVDPADVNDWSALDIEDSSAFGTFFSNFFFGCEAEDRMTAVAFNSKLNRGIKLQAMLGSDIGHWDVLDITKVLADAYELVEDELLTEDDFRAFTFTNALKLYSSMNPDFFKGTILEGALPALKERSPA